MNLDEINKKLKEIDELIGEPPLDSGTHGLTIIDITYDK